MWRFNVPDINWKTMTINQRPQYGNQVNQQMIEMASSLYQVQTNPTRLKNNLDLVFMSNPNILEEIKVQEGISDHECVVLKLNLEAKVTRKAPRTVYQYGKGDMNKVKQQIMSNLAEFK